jgi:hypothetical protein
MAATAAVAEAKIAIVLDGIEIRLINDSFLIGCRDGARQRVYDVR